MMEKDGINQAVIIVGITQNMGPQNLIAGDTNLDGNTVIVDESVSIELGELSTGDTVLINNLPQKNHWNQQKCTILYLPLCIYITQKCITDVPAR